MPARVLPIAAAFALASFALVAAYPRAGLARSAELFGPPWISIETPVNPYDASTRDAFLLVHTFHHGTQADAPVSGGTAPDEPPGVREVSQGLRAGPRRSLSVTGHWPNSGVLVLPKVLRPAAL